MEQQLNALQGEVRELAYRNFKLSEEVGQASQLLQSIIQALEVAPDESGKLSVDAVFNHIEQLKAAKREPEQL